LRFKGKSEFVVFLDKKRAQCTGGSESKKKREKTNKREGEKRAGNFGLHVLIMQHLGIGQHRIKPDLHRHIKGENMLGSRRTRTNPSSPIGHCTKPPLERNRKKENELWKEGERAKDFFFV